MNPPQDWTAQLDQARAAYRDIASLLGDYRRALVDAGFWREEALALVIAYQAQVIGASPPPE